MTPRQQEVLNFINIFRGMNQCNPTCAEIAEAFNFASPNAAHDHLMSLKRQGAIEFRAGKTARGYIVKPMFLRLVAPERKA